MKYHRLYSRSLVCIAAFVLSCSSYSRYAIDYRITVPEESGYYFTDNTDKTESGYKKTGKNHLNTASIKYYARKRGFSPESKIMDKAINEALKGNYTEAEILFNELKDIVNDGTVENNLAVLLETEKRNKEAMNMYINALIKSPGNYIFRSNFVSFICLNRYSKRN